MRRFLEDPIRNVTCSSGIKLNVVVLVTEFESILQGFAKESLVATYASGYQWRARQEERDRRVHFDNGYASAFGGEHTECFALSTIPKDCLQP
jgi:hypothetical protein